MSFEEHVTLGRTGLTVSRLGIASGYGVPARAIEKAFHEHNLNYFYPSLLRRRQMRTAVRNLARSERDRMVIALPLLMKKRYFFEGNLKKLGIDYADILILPFQKKHPSDKVLRLALSLKEEGKVRHLSMSSHVRPLFGQMAKSCADSPIDVYQLRYNAVHTGAEKDIFPHLPEANRPGIVSYTATCWRRLLKPKRMPEGEAPLSAADCYRFVLSNPNVDVCTVGPATDLHLEEACRALEAGPLTDEEMTRIRRIGKHVYDNGG
jgi:aryl-alcohol dehydrogenase-like predicted oxidoreductase